MAHDHGQIAGERERPIVDVLGGGGHAALLASIPRMSSAQEVTEFFRRSWSPEKLVKFPR